MAERQKAGLADEKIECHRKKGSDEHVGQGILPAYAKKRRDGYEDNQKTGDQCNSGEHRLYPLNSAHP